MRSLQVKKRPADLEWKWDYKLLICPQNCKFMLFIWSQDMEGCSAWSNKGDCKNLIIFVTCAQYIVVHWGLYKVTDVNLCFSGQVVIMVIFKEFFSCHIVFDLSCSRILCTMWKTQNLFLVHDIANCSHLISTIARPNIMFYALKKKKRESPLGPWYRAWTKSLSNPWVVDWLMGH